MKKGILSVVALLSLALFIVGCGQQEDAVDVDSLAEAGADEEALLAVEDAEAELGDDEVLVAEGSGAIAGQAVKAGKKKKAKAEYLSCSDSDGGVEKNVAGVVQAKYTIGGRERSVVLTDRYYASNGRFYERYCDGNRHKSRVLSCEVGAEEAAVDGRMAWQCSPIPEEEIAQVEEVAPVEFSSCGTAFESGRTYLLTANIDVSSGLEPNLFCLSLQPAVDVAGVHYGNNVIIDCQGNGLQGIPFSLEEGILITGSGNTLRNCVFTGPAEENRGGTAIYLAAEATGNTFENNRFGTDSTWLGSGFVARGSGNTIRYNTFIRNNIGVWQADGASNTLLGNSFNQSIEMDVLNQE